VAYSYLDTKIVRMPTRRIQSTGPLQASLSKSSGVGRRSVLDQLPLLETHKFPYPEGPSRAFVRGSRQSRRIEVSVERIEVETWCEMCCWALSRRRIGDGCIRGSRAVVGSL
jgi:hypothetical protein